MNAPTKSNEINDPAPMISDAKQKKTKHVF